MVLQPEGEKVALSERMGSSFLAPVQMSRPFVVCGLSSSDEVEVTST